MKTAVLVLLVASSVIAAPSVVLTEYEENEIPRSPASNWVSRPMFCLTVNKNFITTATEQLIDMFFPRDTYESENEYVTFYSGKKDNFLFNHRSEAAGKSYNLVDRAFDIIDGGDVNIHILNLEAEIKDLANRGDAYSQATAVAQTFGTLFALSTGRPGDACTASAFTDAYVKAVNSGDFSGIRASLLHLIGRVNLAVENIVKLVNNPTSVKYTVGVGTGCAGAGRTYRFENAWDIILSKLDGNDAYCSAKRLYNGFNIRSNIVGALATTLSLPPLVGTFEMSLKPAVNFLQAVGNRHDPSAQAAVLAEALLESAARVHL